MPRHARRVDNNQSEIVAELRQIGASVIDLSAVGGGVCDLIVGYRGQTYLIEVKNTATSYGKRGLNTKQQDVADNWRGAPIHVVRSVDEALRVIGAI